MIVEALVGVGSVPMRQAHESGSAGLAEAIALMSLALVAGVWMIVHGWRRRRAYFDTTLAQIRAWPEIMHPTHPHEESRAVRRVRHAIRVTRRKIQYYTRDKESR